MVLDQVWTDVLFFIGFLVSAFIPAWTIRKKNAGTIYILWYLFSLFFVIFLVIRLTAWFQSYPLIQMCGSYEQACRTVYGSLTKIEDELYLLAVVTVLVLVPQLMTYLLSGIFGAAHPPILVEQIRKFVVWSYIKFNVCLAGIQLASGLSKLITHNWIARLELVSAGMWLAVAFAYAAIECSDKAPSSAFEKWPLPQLLRVHKFFTRHVSEEPPLLEKADIAARDSALPKL
jgi:hypothetical protein